MIDVANFTTTRCQDTGKAERLAHDPKRAGFAGNHAQELDLVRIADPPCLKQHVNIALDGFGLDDAIAKARMDL